MRKIFIGLKPKVRLHQRCFDFKRSSKLSLSHFKVKREGEIERVLSLVYSQTNVGATGSKRTNV